MLHICDENYKTFVMSNLCTCKINCLNKIYTIYTCMYIVYIHFTISYISTYVYSCKNKEK